MVLITGTEGREVMIEMKIMIEEETLGTAVSVETAGGKATLLEKLFSDVITESIQYTIGKLQEIMESEEEEEQTPRVQDEWVYKVLADIIGE